MNNIPTINCEWDAKSGILTITSKGDGYVLLEVDDSIYETGQNEASYTIKSAVGKTHHVKTCIYDNDSPESVVWKEKSYIVPKMEQNNGIRPSATENTDNQGVANQGTSGSSSNGGRQTSDTRKFFKTIDVREKLQEMGTIKLPPTQFSDTPDNKTISFESYIIPLKQPDNTSCWITSTVVLLTAIGIIEPSKIKELLESRDEDYILACILEHLYNHNRDFSFSGSDVPVPGFPNRTMPCDNFYLLKKYRRRLPTNLQKQFFETLNGFSTEMENFTTDGFFQLLCDYGPLIVAFDGDDGMEPFNYHIAVLYGIKILKGAEAQFMILDSSEGNFIVYNESKFHTMYNQMAVDNLNNTQVEQALGRNKDYFVPQVIHIPNKIDLGL